MSPDSSWILVFGENRLHRWWWRSGTPPKPIPVKLEQASYWDFTLLGDDRIAKTSGTKVLVCDIDSGEVTSTLELAEEAAWCRGTEDRLYAGTRGGLPETMHAWRATDLAPLWTARIDGRMHVYA